MRSKLILACLVLVLVTIIPGRVVAASADAASSATPISFTNTLPVFSRSTNIYSTSATVSITAVSQLVHTDGFMLLTGSTAKYAEDGIVTSIHVDARNIVSFVKLNANFTIRISFSGGSFDIPVRSLSTNYVLPESLGQVQNVTMGTFPLYAGNVPGLGSQVTISVVPVLNWVPFLGGSLQIVGPASTNRSSIFWSQNSINSTLAFTDNQPVALYLSNPLFSLQNFGMSLYFTVTIGSTTIAPASVSVVQFAYYSAKGPTVTLLTFEPNYRVLYSQLKEAYSSLSDSQQRLQGLLNDTTNKLNAVANSVNQLTPRVQRESDLGNGTAKKVASLESHVNSLSDQVASQSQPSSFEIFAVVISLVAIVASAIAYRTVSNIRHDLST